VTAFSTPLALLWLSIAPAMAADVDASAPMNRADSLLLDMREAYAKGNARQVGALLPRVQGHLLEPLAAYWDMRLRLETASNDDIREYLARWKGTYWEDRLRCDWLLLLGRRRDWTTFLAELPTYRMNDDKQVRCDALHARQATYGPLSLSEREDATQTWLRQKDADEACAALAGRLLDDKLLPTQTAWVRARLGAEANKPKISVQAVGLLNPEWMASTSAILAQPEKYLDDKLVAVRHRTKELVTLALVRLAALNPNAAADQMVKARWRVQLTAEEKSWVWGAIGRSAANRLMPEATSWFAMGHPDHMHTEHLGWWVRAALRAGQWEQVLKAVAAMPPDEQRNPTWVYWRARALVQLKTPDAASQARRLFESIASTQHFYGQLALEALGQAIEAPPPPPPLTEAEKHAAADNPGLQRALKAISIGLRSEGVREWNYTTNLHTSGGMGDRELLAAADLACQNQVWDRCINTSERTTGTIDMLQRFPTPYRDAVVQRTRTIGLDAAYVYGLIRQESRFITVARSQVGASGLMQVMPATARWTAKKIGLVNFHPQQITERDTNIAIGTGYLKLVLDSFDGSLPLAAAAYNAGPGRSRQWRAPGGMGPVLDGAIWAENIPFSETRDYVKRVLANTTNYAALLTGTPQSLRARLGNIGPRQGPENDTDLELP
jgi:soluble lytic murein transglycosylase